MTWLIDLNLYASLTATLAYAYISVANIELKRWVWAALALTLAIISGYFAYGYIQIYADPNNGQLMHQDYRPVFWLLVVGPAIALFFHTQDVKRAKVTLEDELEEATKGAEKLRRRVYNS